GRDERDVVDVRVARDGSACDLRERAGLRDDSSGELPLEVVDRLLEQVDGQRWPHGGAAHEALGGAELPVRLDLAQLPAGGEAGAAAGGAEGDGVGDGVLDRRLHVAAAVLEGGEVDVEVG